MEEKRKLPRIEVNWPVQVFLDDRIIEGTVKNITLKGLFVCFEEPLTLKEELRLSVFTPSEKAIDIVGKTVWSDSYALDEENTPVCIGLSFVKLSTEDISSLREILHGYR
jgi:hypothetical protein